MTASRQRFAADIAFPEGPRWWAGRLVLSDVVAGRVLALDEEQRVEVLAEIERPSGLGVLADGRLAVVSQRRRGLFAIEPGGLSRVADLDAAPGSPNDLLIDALGRGYVSCTGFDLHGGEPARPSVVLAVAPDGGVRVAADELLFPNGMAFVSGGARLVVAESMGARLTAYEVRPDGALAARHEFAALPGRVPDGICADVEDGIWVADFAGGEFVRVREGGAITERVEAGGRRAVACALGGEDGRTLFLLGAETSLPELARGRSRGFAESMRVEVPAARREALLCPAACDAVAKGGQLDVAFGCKTMVLEWREVIR